MKAPINTLNLPARKQFIENQIENKTALKGFHRPATRALFCSAEPWTAIAKRGNCHSNDIPVPKA